MNSSMNLVDRAMDKKKKKSHRTMEFMVQESSTISKMVRRNERREDWESRQVNGAEAGRKTQTVLVRESLEQVSGNDNGGQHRMGCLNQWFWSRAVRGVERVRGVHEGVDVWGSAEEKTVRVEEVKKLCGQGLERFNSIDTEITQEVTTILVPFHPEVKGNDPKDNCNQKRRRG